MSKILVLGSSGQVGDHLCGYLRRKGNDVLEFDLVESINQDLRTTNNELLHEYMRECDFVYFLAFDVGGSRNL